MPHRIPSNIARGWLELDPVYLDTETTGIENAQVCDIAILAADGAPIVDTLVRPTISIPRSATAIHGITDEMVAGAPSFANIWPAIHAALSNRWVVVYKADYDRARLWDSAQAVGIDSQRFIFGDLSLSRSHEPGAPHWLCAMELYAEFHGELDAFHDNYRWQKLGNA
ncbi:MAG TPA: 3'-5' exonuclease, partial [Anaerolineales bacterium]|nr:3'-5' exonuclease [Anaerolineales bacterium]